jgi:8-oxo-dGTP pyrophosphatase MutT (NUDIX family)
MKKIYLQSVLLVSFITVLPVSSFAVTPLKQKVKVARELIDLYKENKENNLLKVATFSLVDSIHTEKSQNLSPGNIKVLNQVLNQKDLIEIMIKVHSALEAQPDEKSIQILFESLEDSYQRRYSDPVDFAGCHNDQVIDVTPSSLKQNRENLFSDVKDIWDVGTHVEQLLENGYDAEEILIVFDVDGTLTNFSEPHHHRGGPFPPRENAVSLVRSLDHKGITQIASSAYHKFDHTLKKLHDLGLSKEFGITPATSRTLHQVFALKSKTTSKVDEFHSFSKGNVVSIAEKGSQYFINKAMAPQIVLSPEALNKIKRVIFVDDNKDYVEQFRKDTQKYPVFGKNVKHFDYFNLTPVSGDKKSNPPQVTSSKPGSFDPTQVPKRGAAGAIVHSTHANSTYVLLGKEKHGRDAGKWSVMLGSVDPGENYLNSAARELEEETAGIVQITPSTLKSMPYTVAHYKDWNDPSKIHSSVCTYLVKVPFQGAQSFRKAAANHRDPHFKEMSDYTWVKWDDLKLTLSQGKKSLRAKSPSGYEKDIVLRDVAHKVLDQARNDGKLN